MNNPTRLNPDQAHRHHRLQVLVAMSIYVALLLGCVYFIKHQHPVGPLLSLAAGVTAFLTLTYGLLEDFAGFPHIAAWWTFVLIDLVWGASSCLLWYRYK